MSPEFEKDHLGSSSVITDSSANKVEEIHYLPFGSAQADSNSVLTTHKFTGQELDAETGLYYYGARYYNPQLGRFVSADSIVPDPRNPQDLNRYTYARNNPLFYTDPTGNFSWKQALGVVEMVVGAALIAVSPFTGPYFPVVATAGVLLMAHGADQLGMNSNAGGGGGVDSGGGTSGWGWNPDTGDRYYGGGGYGGGSRGSEYGTSLSLSIVGTNFMQYELYAEAYFSDAVFLSNDDEIGLLARLTYAEAAGEYKIKNAMEGVAWVVRNRVTANKPWFGGNTYTGVIYSGQFVSVGGNRWNEFSNSTRLDAKSYAAYDRALTVSKGVYYGTIPDPTGGAVYFHSIPPEQLSQRSPWFYNAIQSGRINQSIPKPLGPFYFYK